jgi:hypothetical protein
LTTGASTLVCTFLMVNSSLINQDHGNGNGIRERGYINQINRNSNASCPVVVKTNKAANIIKNKSTGTGAGLCRFSYSITEQITNMVIQDIPRDAYVCIMAI